MKLDKNKVYNHLCTRSFKWYAPKSWVHAIIRKITKCPIDHVGFIFHENGHWLQAEATTGRVKVIALENWLQISKMKSWIQEDRFATLRRDAMIEYAYKCEAVTKYDFLGLVWMAIFIRRKIWLGRKRNQEQRQFCSEFYFNAKGIARSQYKTPKDVMLAGNEIVGFLSGVSLREPIIVEHIRIK